MASVSMFLNFYGLLFLSLCIMGGCAQNKLQMDSGQESLPVQMEILRDVRSSEVKECCVCGTVNVVMKTQKEKNGQTLWLVSGYRKSNQLHGTCRSCVSFFDLWIKILGKHVKDNGTIDGIEETKRQIKVKGRKGFYTVASCQSSSAKKITTLLRFEKLAELCYNGLKERLPLSHKNDDCCCYSSEFDFGGKKIMTCQACLHELTADFLKYKDKNGEMLQHQFMLKNLLYAPAPSSASQSTLLDDALYTPAPSSASESTLLGDLDFL